jgi:hypothetical protein
MANATLTLGANSHQASVSSAALTPSASVVTFKGLTPTAVFSAGTSSTWTLDLSFAQSLSTNDLLLYLFDNELNEVAFTLAPVAGGVTWSGTVIINAAAIGGAVDQYGTSTISLGVKGKPVRSGTP